MITESPSKKVKDVKRLAQRLSTLPQVEKYSSGGHDEAWTLAHAFDDLEESFQVLLAEKFPQLAQDEMSSEELYDLLLEIGEDLRHIQYHIRDPRFFRYLSEDREDAA